MQQKPEIQNGLPKSCCQATYFTKQSPTTWNKVYLFMF